MKKTGFFILLAIITAYSAIADPQTDVRKANTAYQAGYYDNAISLYEKVINDGYASAELYYNLGNAYFKVNKLPFAILYYERALKLEPDGEDIQYNLKVANNQIIDKIDQLPQLFYERWWESVKQLNSPDNWAIYTLIFFAIFFILIALFLLSTSVRMRRILLPASLLILFITGLLFILALESHKKASDTREAVVFTPSLTVKSSPEETGKDLFVIHEGLKVQVTDELTGWREIKIANGSKGWVKSQTITPI